MHRHGLRVFVLVLGCGPRVELASDGTTSGSTGAATTEMSSASASSATSTTTSTSTTTTTTSETSTHGESSSGDGVGFIIDVDGGGTSHECDLWKQNCPRGEKCSSASSYGGVWDSTICTPIAVNPRAVGEPCIVEGDARSGVDDCDIGAMCWHVDPDTNEGECVALCQGSEADPVCEDVCSPCHINANGTLLLCLFNCDPLVQNCHQGEACYPIVDAFECAPDLSGDVGGIGDECEFINLCDPGLLCANPEFVPGCAGASCCTPFCDAAAEDNCDALLPGTTCVPWYEEGQAPETPCFSSTIGFCGVPQ